MIKVIIVDDHPIIRQGIRNILTKDPEIEVIGEAGSYRESVLLIEKQLPDVVLLDLSIPDRFGLDVIELLLQSHPKLKFVILSAHPADQFAIRSLKAGAFSYLNKECDPSDLLQAIRMAAKGEKYITPTVATLLANTINRREITGPAHEQLTNREFQILRMVAEGVSLTEIGNKLGISVKTVSTYRDRVLKKLSAKSNADLVKYVMEHHLDQSV